GIYFDARVESDLEYMLNHRESTPWERWRAEQVIEQLRRANLTKYNVGQDTVLNLPEGRKIILVPGQVEGDASIRFGSPEVKTNEALLRAVRSAEPDAFIIYKPHPDVVAGQRDEGHWQGEFTTLADKVETDTSMATLLDQVDEVHTMTSLAGFEALLRRKQVTTYGMPFYAGWGLTRDNLRCERRVRQHDLASLVYFALIAYPTYLDPITRNACSAEQAIERVRQMKLGEVEVKDSKLQLLLLLKRVKHTGECWFNSTLNSFLRK
ncbi:MAG: capsular polysaccharide biosynthesis protein, partial [Vibrionaceae bacterium]|nr:capsular polysaccharide biosynthesis protein [Vibrionaceae bacterium]